VISVGNSRRETTSINPRLGFLSTHAGGVRAGLHRPAEPGPPNRRPGPAGVTRDDVHVDHASGAKASRPKLDLVLRILRDGDVLVVTRLDRLGRSVLHLVTLGAQLRERGVGLQVVEQGIDTATAEGRAMFGMLSVLAELQRELIVANTRDGLAAARARGRRGGRPPPNSPRIRSHWPNGSMTPGSTPSPRSPACSPCPAAPFTVTSTRPPSVPDPTPRKQQRHRHRPVPKPRPILIGPSTGTPVTPRQHPDHPGRARAAGTNPPHGRSHHATGRPGRHLAQRRHPPARTAPPPTTLPPLPTPRTRARPRVCGVR